jgi:hypothetical protein
MGASDFHRRVIMPLSWLGFGSVKDLLSLPLTMLNRYHLLMGEEGAIDRYWQFHDPDYGSKRRGR